MMWWYKFVSIVSYAHHKFLTVTLLLRVVKNAVWEDLWLSATPGCEVRCPRKKLWHFKNGPENRCLALHTVCHWLFAIALSVLFESDAFSQCVSSYDLQSCNCTDRRFTSITSLRHNKISHGDENIAAVIPRYVPMFTCDPGDLTCQNQFEV